VCKFIKINEPDVITNSKNIVLRRIDKLSNVPYRTGTF
jgi:hypothetical protein